ncbi:Rha family transcriptional regulator [Comamonas thiooxydans]|uniref:Rha family transcriptional regulator n=1 Tax=Comamonas thiooxydans TaxID=363952 RepID=UPI0001BB1127|nr:Rha family transcriptional regulator [Comamonas thiooxydans]ACY32197.1 possible bacteriophage antirepressor [Comamonas thiooxydans]
MSLNSQLSPVAVPLTMSSRDIAELTGKDHFHVMRDLRAMHGQLGTMFGGSIHPWIHPQNGQTYDEYLLDKDTSLTLLLGFLFQLRTPVP